MIWKDNFVQYEEEKPELYGPLWMTITYIVVLGLASNINESIQATSASRMLKKEIFLKGLFIVAVFQIL